jgi:hypothetical protein
LKLQQAELDELNAAYTIDPTRGYMATALAAIQARDPLAVEAALNELRTGAKNSNFPPTDPGMRKLADAMAVPHNDADLVDILKAIAASDEKTARNLLTKLQDRCKKNEFGDAGVKKALKLRDDLTGNDNIPAENTDLVHVNIYLTEKGPSATIPYIARLGALAKAGGFVAISG